MYEIYSRVNLSTQCDQIEGCKPIKFSVMDDDKIESKPLHVIEGNLVSLVSVKPHSRAHLLFVELCAFHGDD